ncbi:MAG: DUF3078 domain-containing protein, partial [Proteiniphilum sp.]|nr:DUF3078 domain-containing protein [Proteiniphilum sp.]
MKRIILSFLIITVCSLGTTASEVESMAAQRPDSIPVPDSLDLFRDVTDIGKQIERRTAQLKEADGSGIISPQQPSGMLPSDTLPGKIILHPASLSDSIVPVGRMDSVYLVRNPLDSIYFRKENGTLQLPANYNNFDSMRGLSFRDTLFYNPLFLPMIFTGKMLPRKLSFYPLDDEHDKGTLVPQEKTFAPRLEHVDFVRSVRRDYYMKYPDRIRYSVTSFDSIPRLNGDDRIVRETFNPFRELIKAETTYSLETPGVEGIAIGRKYWVRSGEHSFQFAQNYFSDNWHKGGTNNLNINSYHLLRANYQRDKVKFNNTLEWRLSVFNAPDDSLRKYRIGNDLIRYYGDFGLDAFVKGWSYSTNLEAKSQLFNAYPVNSDDLRSSFISPLYVNMGIGLKYNLDKKSNRV